MEYYNKEVFIKRLKLLRLERGLTQPELGELLGKTRGAVGHWESGHRIPKVAMLYQLAQFFNVSVEYLVGNSNVRDDRASMLKAQEIFEKYGIIKNGYMDIDRLEKTLVSAKLLENTIDKIMDIQNAAS